MGAHRKFIKKVYNEIKHKLVHKQKKYFPLTKKKFIHISSPGGGIVKEQT